jgi:hypothetical protein
MAQLKLTDLKWKGTIHCHLAWWSDQYVLVVLWFVGNTYFIRETASLLNNYRYETDTQGEQDIRE